VELDGNDDLLFSSDSEVDHEQSKQGGGEWEEGKLDFTDLEEVVVPDDIGDSENKRWDHSVTQKRGLSNLDLISLNKKASSSSKIVDGEKEQRDTAKRKDAILRKHAHRRATIEQVYLSLQIHMAHIRVLVARYAFRNLLCELPSLKARILSQFPPSLINRCAEANLDTIRTITAWFHDAWNLKQTMPLNSGLSCSLCNIDDVANDDEMEEEEEEAITAHRSIQSKRQRQQQQVLVCLERQLMSAFERLEGGAEHLNMAFISLTRALGFRVRLVAALQPVLPHPKTLIPSSSSSSSPPPTPFYFDLTKSCPCQSVNEEGGREKEEDRAVDGGGTNEATKRRSNTHKKAGRKRKRDTNAVAAAEAPPFSSSSSPSSSSQSAVRGKNHPHGSGHHSLPDGAAALWTEIWCPAIEKWVDVHVMTNVIQAPRLIHSQMAAETQSRGAKGRLHTARRTAYILAFQDSMAKTAARDVSKRYAMHWSLVQKWRKKINPLWWNDTVLMAHKLMSMLYEEERREGGLLQCDEPDSSSSGGGGGNSSSMRSAKKQTKKTIKDNNKNKKKRRRHDDAIIESNYQEEDGEKEEEDKEKEEAWACSICTFVNNRNTGSMCAMCGSKRRRVEMNEKSKKRKREKRKQGGGEEGDASACATSTTSSLTDGLSSSLLSPSAPPVKKNNGEEREHDHDDDDAKEDDDLNQSVEQEPIPLTLGECKKHPIYAVEHFLTKFQVIRPKGKEHIVGTIISKGKVYHVYRRCNVHTLQSREKWIRSLRQVKEGEDPVKLVRGRRRKGEEEGQQIALFGEWQTNRWKRPKINQDGSIPRSKYGHVEVWTKGHLPLGCLHVDLPRCERIAKKLGIQFAPAMTGFEVKSGRSVPVISGIVVRGEDAEIVKMVALYSPAWATKFFLLIQNQQQASSYGSVLYSRDHMLELRD